MYTQILKTGDLLVGSGGGSVALVKGNGDKYGLAKPAKKVQGAVTSIALRGEGHQFFVGTNKSEILRYTSAHHRVLLYCVAFFSIIPRRIDKKGPWFVY